MGELARHFFKFLVFTIFIIVSASFVMPQSALASFDENTNNNPVMWLEGIYLDGYQAGSGPLTVIDKDIPIADNPVSRAYYQLNQHNSPREATYALNANNQRIQGPAKFLWVVFPGDTIQLDWKYSAQQRGESNWSSWTAYDGYENVPRGNPGASWNPANTNALCWSVDNHNTGGTVNNLEGEKADSPVFFEKGSRKDSPEGLDVHKTNSSIALTVSPSANIPPEGKLIQVVHWTWDNRWWVNEWYHAEPYYILVMPETIQSKVYMLYDTHIPDHLNAPGGVYNYGPSGDNVEYTTLSVNLKKLMYDPDFYAQFAYKPKSGGSKASVFLSIDNMAPGVGYELPMDQANPSGVPMGTYEEIQAKRKLASQRGWEYLFAASGIISDEDKAKVYKMFPGRVFGYVFKWDNFGSDPYWHVDIAFKDDPPNYMLEIYDVKNNSAGKKPVISSKVKSASGMTQHELFEPVLQPDGKMHTYYSEVIANYVGDPSNPVNVTHNAPYGFSYRVTDIEVSPGSYKTGVEAVYFRDAKDGSGPSEFDAVFYPYDGEFNTPLPEGYVPGMDLGPGRTVVNGDHVHVVPQQANCFGINANPATPEEFLRYYEYPGKTFIDRLYMSCDETVTEKKLGSLTLEKIVNPETTGVGYTFTISAAPELVSSIKDKQFPVVFSDGRTQNTVQFNSTGQATVTLEHGQTATINLPSGTYTVSEAESVGTKVETSHPDGSGVDTWVEGTSTSVTIEAQTNKVIKFRNTFLGTLMIDKTVSGNAANIDEIFEFSVIADAGDVDKVKNKQFPVVYSDGRTENTLLFDNQGQANISLKHGQSAVISLPDGYYTVKENKVETIYTKTEVSTAKDSGGQPIWNEAQSAKVQVVLANQSFIKFKNTTSAAPSVGAREFLNPFVIMVIVSTASLALIVRRLVMRHLAFWYE